MRPRAEAAEDQGLVTRFGWLEIEWPKAFGYFGGVWLAVAYDLIAPPIGLFIAAIPILKLFKHPAQPWPIRFVTDTLEGAAKPVGGDAESTIRLAARRDPPRSLRAKTRRRQSDVDGRARSTKG